MRLICEKAKECVSGRCFPISVVPRLLAMLCIACLFLLPCTVGAVGQRHLVPVAPDSSDFIKASVMCYSPLDNYQSVLGHCALHMECPSEGFDVIFGLAEDFDVSTWRHLLGHYRVMMSSMEAASQLDMVRKEGRQVVEYPLNLTHHEKQRLWMLLDKEVAQRFADKNFCLVNGHCTSAVIHVLERCTINEYLDLGPRQGPLAMSQGDYLRWMFRESPWYLFAVVTLIGDRFDKEDPVDHITCTELIIPLLKQATLRSPDNADSVTVRPLIIDTGHEVLPLVDKPTTSRITPRMVFLALLVLTLLVTFLEWFFQFHRLAQWFDGVLFVLYAFWAVMVAWLAIVGSTIADAHWNWYLIPFNPLPIIVWACRRNRSWYMRVFLLYAVVLTLFLLATPLSSQIDLDHQLITASLAIRCYSQYFHFRNLKQ